MTLMVVGNGASRLKHEEFIKDHDDEVWACNYEFREDWPRLSAIGSLHKRAVRDALIYRKEHGLNYEVITNETYANPNWGQWQEGAMSWSEGRISYRLSSGIRLIQEAFVRGHDKVILIGFDLGGECAREETPTPKEDFFKNQYERLVEAWPEKNIERLR